MAYPAIYERTVQLLGEDNFAKLKKAKIAIVGLGGVGGTCFMCLLRSGLSAFLLVDDDVINENNLNRQILYSPSDVGKTKVEAAKQYARPYIENEQSIAIDSRWLGPDNIDSFGFENYDVVIDCIDDVPAKVALAEYCLQRHIPFLVSLGMGNRLDPTKVSLTSLDKTEGCPLARKLRYELRKKGIDIRRITVAFSSEEPLRKGSVPASIMTVPSAAGLALAYEAMKILLFNFSPEG